MALLEPAACRSPWPVRERAAVLARRDLEVAHPTIFAMFHIPFHIVVPTDSPIKSFADLKGKRVSSAFAPVARRTSSCGCSRSMA